MLGHWQKPHIVDNFDLLYFCKTLDELTVCRTIVLPLRVFRRAVKYAVDFQGVRAIYVGMDSHL